MLSLKSKFEEKLKLSLQSEINKNYRVLIKYSCLKETLENKIKALKGTVIETIESLSITAAIISGKSLKRISEYPYVLNIISDEILIISASSVLASNGIINREKYKLTGKGISIGIIDTGVYPHADLLFPHNKIKKFYDLIKHLNYPYDDNGHGTFLSGIICSSGSLSKGMYRGVSEEASIYMIKAFNSLGRGYASDIFYAINLLINESNEHNIKVICLPFEMLCENHSIKECFNILFKKADSIGISIVVPSGNCGPLDSTIKGFASLDNCITVGGLDSTNGIRAYQYASLGPMLKCEKPNLSAACVNICSLNANTSYISERNGYKIYPGTLEKPYTTYSGTSIGAAFISGVCALLYQNNIDITMKDIKSTLKINCNIQNLNKNVQGDGLIDLTKI